MAAGGNWLAVTFCKAGISAGLTQEFDLPGSRTKARGGLRHAPWRLRGVETIVLAVEVIEMRRGIIAIGMLFCGNSVTAMQAHAFDDSYSFSGFGEGNRTCDEYIAARQSESAARASQGGADNVQYTMTYAAIYAFVEGWVTGADLFLPHTYSLFPDGLGPAMTWLDDYCRQNPSKKLAAALPLLWLDAFPNREQAAPK